jgi:hypothetical protein
MLDERTIYSCVKVCSGEFKNITTGSEADATNTAWGNATL